MPVSRTHARTHSFLSYQPTVHKENSNCSGKRDRTAFINRGQLDDTALLNDYRFLEQVKLAEDVAKRAKPPTPRGDLPGHLRSLVYQAERRGVTLHLLAPGMQRRKSNTTRYDGKHQTLNWRIEWNFKSAGCRASNVKVNERTLVGEVLGRHLTPGPGATLKTKEMQRYAECGVDALCVLMRKERTPANEPTYYKIDCGKSVGEVVRRKVVVEFPVFLVLLPDDMEEMVRGGGSEGAVTIIDEEERGLKNDDDKEGGQRMPSLGEKEDGGG